MTTVKIFINCAPLFFERNIVSTVTLGCNLDLKKIALQARNAEYNPKRFAAVIMRIRKPRTTALIFSSGKMVCTGAKSEEDSRLAARKYARIVQKLGFNVMLEFYFKFKCYIVGNRGLNSVILFFFFFWLRKLPEYYFLAQAFANLHGNKKKTSVIICQVLLCAIML